MKVEIWSDVACPFCYLGKRYFENALKELSFKDEIEVEWKSFQLDPDLPIEGLGITTYEYLMERKQLPAEYLEKMLGHLQQSGELVDINFQQEQSIPVNTIRAHRLIHFAQNKGLAAEIEEALFKAFFTDGKNVGDFEVLAELAEGIGLDKEEVLSFLKTDELTTDVMKDIEEAQSLGIGGVPFFVVDRKYGISGAQPVEVFKETLTQAYNEGKPEFEMKGQNRAHVCGPDGCEM